MNEDIFQKLEIDFSEEFEVALKIIKDVDPERISFCSDRIIRAIIFLSKGNINALKNTVEIAYTDYRDVLWQAEYNCKEKRIYDFNKTFHQLKMIHKS